MIKEFGSSFREETDVSTLDTSMVRQMVDRISQMSFSNPTGAVLAPAGEYNLHLGVMKEMRPDMIATSTQDVTVRLDCCSHPPLPQMIATSTQDVAVHLRNACMRYTTVSNSRMTIRPHYAAGCGWARRDC